MTTRRLLLILLAAFALVAIVGVVAPDAAWAGANPEEKFPPPDLGPDYRNPLTTSPDSPDAAPIRVIIDIIALIAALLATSYVVLVLRSRAWTFVMMVLCLAFFGFYRQGCVCPIGAIQNVSVAAFDASYEIPVVVTIYFFAPLITTLFFGRSFCAAVCPLGAIQDVMLVRPYRIPVAVSHALGLLRYVYLGAGVLFAATASAFVICQYDPFIAIFRLTGEFNMLVLGGCFLVVSMFIGRPYCRFLCPYGVLLGWCSYLSRWRITITPSNCVVCRLCEEKACPFEAISMPTAPSVEFDRYRGRLMLLALLVGLPVLTLGGAWLGYEAAPRMARMNYFVRALDRVEAEAAGVVEGTTDVSDSIRGSGQSLDDLRKKVDGIVGRFRIGTPILFGFIGLVIAIKLILLTVRRTQVDYQADREACYACARCYEYCPVEQEERRGAEGAVAASLAMVDARACSCGNKAVEG